jgi:hypothetical protein
LSLLAALSLLGAAALVYTLYPSSPPLAAASLALCGTLLLPSAFCAAWGLRRPATPSTPAAPRGSATLFATLLMILVFPATLWLGDQFRQGVGLDESLFLLLHVVAIGLPVFWLTSLARSRLAGGSAQRAWGLFGSGMLIGTPLIFATEIAVMIVAAMLFLASQPYLTQRLTELLQEYRGITPDYQAIIPTLEPYINQPLVVYGAVAFIAILVPLIEEAIKPIGVWLLIKRNLTPAEGFVAGMFSGAGFALVENLGYVASGIDQWALTAMTRTFTAAMHIFTAGLMGWGLAYAWGRGKYLRLAIAYLGAVFVHAAWNGMVVLSAGILAQVAPQLEAIYLVQLGLAGFMGLILIGLLVGFNRALRPASNQLGQSEPFPPTETPHDSPPSIFSQEPS